MPISLQELRELQIQLAEEVQDAGSWFAAGALRDVERAIAEAKRRESGILPSGEGVWSWLSDLGPFSALEA